MNLMLELEEDDQDWARQEYTEEVPDEGAVVGEEAIERAATGIGRLLVPPVVQVVQEFSTNPDFRYRRAAVAALSRLAEGATEIFQKEYLQATFPFLQSALSDSSPRVRYQAIQAIGQFATLFPKLLPGMVELYFDHLVNLMGDASQCDRVRGHAVSALINICRPHEDDEGEEEEGGDNEDEGNRGTGLRLSPVQVNHLLSVLCSAMQTTSLHVQPVCLLLLGCVARSSKESFVEYYPLFMPGIKSIMRDALTPQLSVLRGKAMECVGIIGEAVGDEIFAPDALEVMELLLQAIVSPLSRPSLIPNHSP
jgi:importin-5